MSVRVPKYRFHKASGQALVEIQGRHFYLGKFDSPESHEQYRRLITQYLSQQEATSEDAPRIPDKVVEAKRKSLLARIFGQQLTTDCGQN